MQPTRTCPPAAFENTSNVFQQTDGELRCSVLLFPRELRFIVEFLARWDCRTVCEAHDIYSGWKNIPNVSKNTKNCFNEKKLWVDALNESIKLELSASISAFKMTLYKRFLSGMNSVTSPEGSLHSRLKQNM